MFSKKLLILCLLGILFLLTARGADEKEEQAKSEEGEEEEEEGDEEEEEEKPKSLDHGFGKDIDWVSWNDALELAKEKDKPVFLLIHKTWCHACQALKKKFEQASFQKELKAMSKHFIMTNTEDDEEPWEEKYQPDGKYIPRIFFIKPDGEVMADITNEKEEYKQYKYYFADPNGILDSMKLALTKLGRWKQEEKKTGKSSESKPPTAKPPMETEKKEEMKEEKKEEKMEEKKSEMKEEKMKESKKQEEKSGDKKDDKKKKKEL